MISQPATRVDASPRNVSFLTGGQLAGAFNRPRLFYTAPGGSRLELRRWA